MELPSSLAISADQQTKAPCSSWPMEDEQVAILLEARRHSIEQHEQATLTHLQLVWKQCADGRISAQGPMHCVIDHWHLQCSLTAVLDAQGLTFIGFTNKILLCNPVHHHRLYSIPLQRGHRLCGVAFMPLCLQQSSVSERIEMYHPWGS